MLHDLAWASITRLISLARIRLSPSEVHVVARTLRSCPLRWAHDAPSVWNVYPLIYQKSGTHAFPSGPITSTRTTIGVLYFNHLSPLLDFELNEGRAFAWLIVIYPS